MIFRHRVKYNGVLYLAGQDVPIEEDVKSVEEKETVEAQAPEPQKPEEEDKPVRKRGRRAKRE